jgi:hypothetical protein
MDMELKGREKAMQMQMDQQEHTQKMQMQQEETMNKAASDIALTRVFQATAAAKGHQQLQQADQAHQQKMAQTKESMKLSPKQNSKSGNTKR